LKIINLSCSSKICVFQEALNTKKLLNSKWTSVKLIKKEKHFLITELELDENDNVIHCLIEALISHRVQPINWAELKENEHWIQGWK
jgi:tryptophan-rich hypothetical protein